jgi:hypothetical protein
MTAAMSSAMLVLHCAAPTPGAVMHWAYLAALSDVTLSGGMLLRPWFGFGRLSSGSGSDITGYAAFFIRDTGRAKAWS